MEISRQDVDGGRPFDWGRTSPDYAKYRDVYPPEFYRRIIDRKLCVRGQTILDVGTGTGVLPRNLSPYGAKWVGADLSERQIEQARRLSAGLDIEYYALPAEKLDFPAGAFDVITACQCHWYFDHERVCGKFFDMLKPDGRLLFLYMAWLPFEDDIAAAGEALVLKYNPNWSGKGETMHPIEIPACYRECFDVVCREEYPLYEQPVEKKDLDACRGVLSQAEAAFSTWGMLPLSEAEIAGWEREHIRLLEQIAPPEFDVRHYGAMAELKKRG